MKLSLDGISESRSTNISLDVYCVKINECKSVYPIRIIRPLSKLSVNYMSQFQKVLDEIQLTDTELTHVIADNPKRAFVRNSLCHGARFACEYCYAQGIEIWVNPPFSGMETLITFTVYPQNTYTQYVLAWLSVC